MERSTSQRVAIRRAFERADRPLSPGEVLVEARRDVSQLGIATVYRSIKSLQDDGWLAAVELPGESPRYELSGKQHHHHFHCGDCYRVFEIPCHVSPAPPALPRAFRVDRHEVVLYGRCDECRPDSE